MRFFSNISKHLQKPAVFLTALYTLAWGPMLFLRGAYWDGWIFFSEFTHKDFTWVRSEFEPSQNLYHYYTFRVLELTPDPSFVGRAIVFLSWLIAGLILFNILRRFFKWNTYTATIVSAYFLIYPVYIVRFEFIHFYYSVSLLAFAVASYLYLDFTPRSRLSSVTREISALALFVVALFTNSFAFFFFGFLAAHFVLFAQNQTHSLLEAIKKWLLRFWYLLAFPFLFMAIVSKLFAPYGPYEHYNRILLLHPNWNVFSIMIEGGWGGLWAGFLWPFAQALMLLERKYFAVALLFAVLVTVVLFRYFKTPHAEIETPERTEHEHFYARIYRTNPRVSILILGASFLFLGLFPYVVVGKFPHIYGNGFGLRHSLLMSLGSALILFGAVTLFVRNHFQTAIHGALLSLSIAFIWFNIILLDYEWYKQQAIMAKLPAIVAEIPAPATLAFSDEVAGYNWIHRRISLQDYRGWLRLVTGTWGYQGVGLDEYERGSFDSYLRPDSTVKIIRIMSDRNADDPKVLEWLYLKSIEMRYGQDRLRQEASRILQISLINAGDAPNASTRVQ